MTYRVRIRMEKSVTTQLLQEALGRFGGDVDWIDTGFDQLLFVGDFYPRTIFHGHDLFSCEFWIGVRHLDVAKLWVVKILTESITILEFIEIVNLFIEQSLALFVNADPISLRVAIQQTTLGLQIKCIGKYRELSQLAKVHIKELPQVLSLDFDCELFIPNGSDVNLPQRSLWYRKWEMSWRR